MANSFTNHGRKVGSETVLAVAAPCLHHDDEDKKERFYYKKEIGGRPIVSDNGQGRLLKGHIFWRVGSSGIG